MNHILYISGFVLSAFIIYLIMKDLRKFKPILYNEIYYKIWIKIYAIITIFIIHSIWLITEISSNNLNDSIIYGVPLYLLFAYIIYISAYIRKDHIEAIPIASQKLDDYLNLIISIYFIFIIIIAVMPNDFKK